MTDILWQVLGGALSLIGIIGCMVPVIPGPILSFCGLLCLVPTSASPSQSTLVAFGAVTAAVTVLDYVVPAVGAKKFKCSGWGTFGCAVGTIVGLFFFPVGLIAGPFLGAFVGELVAGRTTDQAFRGGFGALLGFLTGVLLKLAACIAMTVAFARGIL